MIKCPYCGSEQMVLATKKECEGIPRFRLNEAGADKLYRCQNCTGYCAVGEICTARIQEPDGGYLTQICSRS